LERENSISKTHTEKGLDIFKAVKNVEIEFNNSIYKENKKELKRFFIFEGVYSFLAYFAFVKDEKTAELLFKNYQKFIKQNNIKLAEILSYQRFGKNYLLSLPLKKRFYLFCFFGMGKIIKTLM
jgi:hypothetical protein